MEKDKNTRREILQLLAALTIGKVAVLLFTFLYRPSLNFLYAMSTQWDSNRFQSIATQGYAQSSQYAFSPVYPVLIKSLDFIIPHAWISSLIITNIISFIFPVVLYKTFGFKTTLLAILFPTYLVFTTIPYSDVIPLLFLALSLFFILQEKIIESSTAVSIAVMSAFRIVWMLPAHLFEALKTRRIKNLAFCIIPLIAGALILLWFKLSTGDFRTYFWIETDIWGEQFTTPIAQARWIMSGWFTAESWKVYSIHLLPIYWLGRNLLFELFYLVGAFYLLWTKDKHRVFLFLFSLSASVPLLFVIGTPAISVPRLLLPAFPVFFSYAKLMKKDWHYWVYFTACLLITAWIAISQTYSFFA